MNTSEFSDDFGSSGLLPLAGHFFVTDSVGGLTLTGGQAELFDGIFKPYYEGESLGIVKQLYAADFGA
jgi:hypothetical protein